MGADKKSSDRPLIWIAEPLVPAGLMPAPEWSVRSMLPEIGLGILYGQPGSLKTWEIIALLMCLYTGLEFCGQRTKQCLPLYIAADPDHDTPRARAQAWVKYYESILRERGIVVDFSKLPMFRKAVNLCDPAQVAGAAEDIKQQGIKPDFIAFDTLFHSSSGADLTKPEQLVPMLDRTRLFMKEIGARGGVLLHHPPKDGKSLFGTQALLANVDWVWRSDATGPTSATLTCERIKLARAFAPIKLNFHSMMLQMAPNSWGDEWVEQLVLDLNVKAKAKEDLELNDMETNLECFLDNQATSAVWFDQMVKWTSHNGEQEGWSRKTFDRRLKKLKTAGRVVGTGKQGDLYSVLHTPEAEQARRTTQDGDTTREAEPAEPSSVEASSVQPPSSPSPLRGVTVVDDGFGTDKPPSNHRQTDFDGGSREGGNDQNSVVPGPADEPDLVDEALRHAHDAKKKPA